MAKLRRRIIETTIRWEETENLTPEQIEKWKTGDYDITSFSEFSIAQEEVMDEVKFEFHIKEMDGKPLSSIHDSVIDNYELIEEEG